MLRRLPAPLPSGDLCSFRRVMLEVGEDVDEMREGAEGGGAISLLSSQSKVVFFSKTAGGVRPRLE